MKIILDDRRPMPEKGPYNCVRTYEDCAFLIRNFRTISFISLDYDLGGKETGYTVLEYMVKCGNHVKHISIHSDHSVGVPKMRKFMENISPTRNSPLIHCNFQGPESKLRAFLHLLY